MLPQRFESSASTVQYHRRHGPITTVGLGNLPS